jgi:hypothetical protein
LRQVSDRGVAPPRIAGQLLRDAIVEALAGQGLPDVGRDAGERVGKLCLELLQGCLGGIPLGGELASDLLGPGREPYLLAGASGPGPVASQPWPRMAATFWLSAECVCSRLRASSAIVIGPCACSLRITVTQLGLRSAMPLSV